MKKKIIASLTAALLVLFAVMPTSLASTKTVTKDESVYVVTDADGNVKNKIVSDTLKNTTKGEKISDKSGLSDIENISGDQKFTKSSLTKALTWKSDGNDITYQGTTNKDLPVDVNITYTLNGHVVSANKLAGKSGKLKIRYDYSTSSYSSLAFMAVTGIMVDTDKISNVKVTNGKAIQEGDTTILVGYAMPGLSSSLGLSGVSIPSYFEVTANVKNFETGGSMSYVTNEVFSDLDLSSVNSAMDLVNSMDKLSSSSKLLVSGSDKLYEGITTLVDKSGALTTGVKQLDEGGKKLANGTKQVKTGAETLNAGSNKLEAGVKEAGSGAGTLAKKLDETGNTDVAKAIEGLNSTIKATETACDQLTEALKAIDPQTNPKAYKAVATALAYLQGQDGKGGSIAGQKEVLTGTNKLKLAMTKDGMTYMTQAGGSDYATKNSFYKGALSLQTTLTTKTSDYKTNPTTVYDGVAAIQEGSSELSTGIDSLVTGSQSLSEGLSTLQENSGKLISGIQQLQEGSKTLKEGMSKFDSQGIQKLVKAAGSIENLKTRLNSTVASAKNYNNFSGIGSNMSGSVKFIYKSSAIEKADK